MQAMHDESAHHRVLGGMSRARLLSVLRQSRASRGVEELAAAVDLHPNTTRAHLDLLVEAGLVERERSEPRGRGRPAFRYRASHHVDDTATYRALAGVLAAELARRPDAHTGATAAGERWGRAAIRTMGPAPHAADALDRLVDLLDESGFAPSRDPDAGHEIRLRHCPFGSLVHEHRDVVCNIHLGLMRGALQELGAPFDAVALEPLVEPGLCVAHVGTPSDGR